MTIGDYILSILAVMGSILAVIEKSQKIKFSPLSGLFGYNKMKNEIKELTLCISELKVDFNKATKCEEERYKKQARIHISNFAKDIKLANQQKLDLCTVKSKEQFIAIIDLCKEYLEQNWNSGIEHDAKFINDTFDDLYNQY